MMRSVMDSPEKAMPISIIWSASMAKRWAQCFK